jgi:hypothetical protein
LRLFLVLFRVFGFCQAFPNLLKFARFFVFNWLTSTVPMSTNFPRVVFGAWLWLQHCRPRGGASGVVWNVGCFELGLV